MLPEKRNLDRARANKDDRAGRYLLSDSNSRRRSQVQFFRPSSSSNGCSWISKFNLPFKPSFLMHGPDGTGVKCRDRNCEGRGVVAPEVQKRSDRSTRKSKKNPKNNKKVHGNSNEPPMTPLPQLPPENTELSLPVLMEQVTSAPTTSMATVTEGLETATPEASTLYFKYITRDPTAAIPTEIIVLNPTGPVSPISSPTHSVDASPTSSGNPQPGGNFFNNPAAVAGVAVGATLGTSLLLTIIGWFMMKFLRKRRDRQVEAGAWADEKKQYMEPMSPNTSGDFDWDPESTFAPPFVKPPTFRQSYSRSSTSSIIQRLIDHARRSTQGGLALSSYLWRHKPLPQPPPENTSELTVIKSTAPSVVEEVPKIPEKSHATISTRSSDILCPDLPNPAPCTQEDPPTTPRKVHGRTSMSKLSWSTPTTKTTSIGSLPQGQRLPSLNSNYAGTVFSEDSEAPRFRSTSSWVLHQQANLRRKLADLDYPPSPTAVPNSPSVRELIERNSLKEEPEAKKRLSLTSEIPVTKDPS